MPNEQLDYQLAHLEAEIVLLGGLVETAIFKSVRALKNRDLDMSREVIAEDDRIDDLETKIQNDCVEQIRRQAPLAADLRRIVGMMFIANELERMGDYAEGISKVSINMGHEAPLKELEDIPKMADLAVSMMKRSIDAMTIDDRAESGRIAIEIENDDDEVDRLYEKVQKTSLHLSKMIASAPLEEPTSCGQHTTSNVWLTVRPISPNAQSSCLQA